MRCSAVSTIFIDRDGVINENRADHVKSWEEFRFIEGSREALAQLTHAGHRLIVCTNQGAIARGLVSIEMVEDIHRRMIEEIAAAGGAIERVYYCPHSKHGYCACRKPRPGMLLRARNELGVNLREAVFIGDSVTDVQAALAVGVQPILVLTGLGRESLLLAQTMRAFECTPLPVARDLSQAAECILRGLHQGNGCDVSASINTFMFRQ
jgi:D-glycero-D-manno-heptose 1,7-bisphosphate phosphatase